MAHRVAGMTATFISGASSGIGAELARQLAARGEHVALAARRVDRLDGLASEFQSLGVMATVHELDVRDPDAVDAAIRSADDAHGGLDRVVVNAGTGGGARIGTGHHRDNVALFEVNLLGALAQAEVALSLFRPRDRGHLVLVSSVAAVRPMPGSLATYGASKAALRHLGGALALDCRGTGVDVTTVLPGWVDSEMTAGVTTRFKTDTTPAVAELVEILDDRPEEAWLPGWWKVVGRGVLPLVPRGVLRRFA